jgi:hypothetical protein
VSLLRRARAAEAVFAHAHTLDTTMGKHAKSDSTKPAVVAATTTKKSALGKVQIKAPSKKVAAAAAAAAAAVVAAAAASKRPDSDIGLGDSRIHRLLRRHAIQSADSAAFEELRVIGRAIVNQLLLGAALVTTAHSHMMIDVGDVREAAQHTLGVRVAGVTDLAYPVKDVKALTDKQKAVRANRLANLQRGRDVTKAKKAAAAAAAAAEQKAPPVVAKAK